MNLNKTHKAKIVRAIMADIPQVNYASLICDYVQAEALELLPPEVLPLYHNEKLRRYLECADLMVNGSYLGWIGSIYWPRATDDASRYCPTINLTRRHYNNSHPLTLKLLDKVHAKVVDYCEKAERQRKDRDSMEQKLETILAGIRTLKQAKTLLEPELHKYLPAEPAKADQKAAQASTALVPYVVANLREMGWPKTEEAA